MRVALLLTIFLFSSCDEKSAVQRNLPKETRDINSVTQPNEFREAYVIGIVRDLNENGNSSRYAVKEGGRIDFENFNIFVTKYYAGYVKSPMGPTKVIDLKSGKWHYEE